MPQDRPLRSRREKLARLLAELDVVHPDDLIPFMGARRGEDLVGDPEDVLGSVDQVRGAQQSAERLRMFNAPTSMFDARRLGLQTRANNRIETAKELLKLLLASGPKDRERASQIRDRSERRQGRRDG